MQLRQGTAEDIDAIIELRRDCYPSSPSAEALRQRYLYNSRFRIEEALWVGEQGGRVVASLLLIPLASYWPGGILSMTGVAGVAVHPSYRRQGWAQAMLREALPSAPAAVTGLYPFRSGFYARLGYASVCQNLHFEVSPEALPRPLSWQPLQPVPIEALANIYQRAESSLGRGALVRNAAFWQRLLEDPELRIHGLDDGYLIYVHHPEASQPLTSQLEIVECVAAQPSAWVQLVGHLHGLKAQVSRIHWPDAGDSRWPLGWTETVHPWGQELRGENLTVGRISAGMMLRFLDFNAAWEGRSYLDLGKWDMKLTVTDPLDFCQGTFHLRFESGQVKVEALSEPALASTDVGSLTQLWSGAVGWSELYRWGRLHGPLEQWQRLGQACRTEARPYVHGSDCF